MLKITEYSLGPTCRYCVAMKKAFVKWTQHTKENYQHTELNAAEHRDELLELGARTAPVWVIKDDSREYVVSGLNTDALIDILDGQGDFWEEEDAEEI